MKCCVAHSHTATMLFPRHVKRDFLVRLSDHVDARDQILVGYTQGNTLLPTSGELFKNILVTNNGVMCLCLAWFLAVFRNVHLLLELMDGLTCYEQASSRVHVANKICFPAALWAWPSAGQDLAQV